MKDMRFIFGVFLIVIGMILAGCLSTPVEPFTPLGSESQIIGIWELQPAKGQYGQTFIFEEGGTFRRQNHGEVPQTGYFAFDGVNLKIATNNFNITTIAKLEGNRLTITYPNQSVWMYEKTE